ncbi:MAG TPA: sigma-70 family RNA polymerase sigma factor [Polyangiaceae bacterium]|nr:sigma-70 family RNA polymerase sigma factor [Polyangiaceae bacterium]
MSAASQRVAPEGRPAARVEAPPAAGGVPFELVYNDYFDFVWRSLRRLGVAESSVEDALQDVFVVVHRRLDEFGGRSSLKTWLFGIALRVTHDHRRRVRRKGGHEPLDEAVADPAPGPQERAANAEMIGLLDRALDALDDDRRAVFVLAELEQMSAPEIAEALGVKLNTVYSRLRLARQDFERAFAGLRHQEGP